MIDVSLAIMRVIQHLVGVLNAFMLVDAVADGALARSALSAFGVIVTAQWPFPSTDKDKHK